MLNYVICKKCARNKNTGLDELPGQLYQATWDSIGQDFVKVLQCQLESLGDPSAIMSAFIFFGGGVPKYENYLQFS